MKNKLNASILYLPLFLLTLFSCGNVEEEEEIIESDVIAQEELEEEVDPFYAAIDENSTLEEYWELFIADAIRSGKPDPGYGRTINLFFGNEPDFASGVTADHAGRAYDVCNDETVSLKSSNHFGKIFLLFKGYNILS